MRLLRDLWATSARRTALVVLLLVLTASGQVLASAVAGPVLVDRSALFFGLLAAGLLLNVAGELATQLIAARLTADWSSDVRRRLCRVALSQDLPRLEATPVGELLDRIDGDVYQVASDLRTTGLRLAGSAVTAALSVVAATVVWWPAGLGMLGLSLVLVASLHARAGPIAVAREAEEEAWSDLAAVMEESIHGQDDVRTSLARPYVMSLYADRASRVLSRGRHVWDLAARFSVVATGVIRVGMVAVVLSGVWALTTDRVDGARLTSIWLLVVAFGLTVDHVARMVPELQQALGAWERVQSLEALPQEPAGGLTPTDGDLEVRGLTVRYPHSDAARPAALTDVHLTFRRGRSYAVIGRTGSGKSTLAKALTRSLAVPPGTVFLGGVDVLRLDLVALRRWIAVVSQRTDVLAGTLAQNVALFDPALEEAAVRAVDELGLTSWVADLPDGMQTRLGEGGHVLSAGQEQLVAFARILVRDPHVVILDEATARMDPVTEARVQEATARLLRGRIGIVIAHRLSSVRACDEVVVLADGEVVESGPLQESTRFARLLASGRIPAPARRDVDLVGAPSAPEALPPRRAASVAPQRQAPASRTMRQILQMTVNDARFGLGSVGVFAIMMLVSLEGSVLPWLWADLVDGEGDPWWTAAAMTAGLLIAVPLPYLPGRWFPEWYVRQMLRISGRLVYGQTGARREGAHTPAEVVAQGGDTERVVFLADNLLDQFVTVFLVAAMTLLTGSVVPAAFFVAAMVISGLAAAMFAPGLSGSAQRTVDARGAFATALVSSLSAARTVKLAGATSSVLAHLARLDAVRSDRQRREIVVQVWARSMPSLTAGLAPIAVWALYLGGTLTAGATLVAVSVLGSARWFAWTVASLVSQLPSARVWTRRTVAMTGVGDYTAVVPGVDISAGTAPAPVKAQRHPLRRLDLSGFGAVHDDGTVGAEQVDLTVERGQLVLVVGPVGSGKSSLLRALAGIVDHTGELRWNGRTVTDPEQFLRPNQVAYVAQLPRVLSGTIGDNIALGHEVDAAGAVSTAQLEHDLSASGGALGLVIGHKGTRLSGGQLQRLALARALAPRTELLIADDVSSALDVTTELDLWRALREHGVTVVGSTSKEAALFQADHVVVLIEGRAMAQGTWQDLQPHWAHLAG